MNNLLIGGPGWTYYETIGGGQGAGNKAPGPSGVHVGMSNTLNTTIEAFEMEYPMRVERYELLYGTGGDGENQGGDGIVRAVRVLESASLSLLTDRRRHAFDRATPYVTDSEDARPAGLEHASVAVPGRSGEHEPFLVQRYLPVEPSGVRH